MEPFYIEIAGRPLDPAATYSIALSEGLLYAIRLANEKFHLENFYRGIDAVSRYFELLGATA